MTASATIDDRLIEVITLSGDDYDEATAAAASSSDQDRHLVEHLSQWDCGEETDNDREAAGEVSTLEDWRKHFTCDLSAVVHGGIVYLLANDTSLGLLTLLRHPLPDLINSLTDSLSEDLEVCTQMHKTIVYDNRLNPIQSPRWVTTVRELKDSKVVAVKEILTVSWDPLLGFVLYRVDAGHNVQRSARIHYDAPALVNELELDGQLSFNESLTVIGTILQQVEHGQIDLTAPTPHDMPIDGLGQSVLVGDIVLAPNGSDRQTLIPALVTRFENDQLRVLIPDLLGEAIVHPGAVIAPPAGYERKLAQDYREAIEKKLA